MTNPLPVPDGILISGAAPTVFDARIAVLFAQTTMDAGLPSDTTQVLDQIPRVGAFVVQASEPLLSHLAAADVRSVVLHDERSVHIPSVRIQADP
jgi:predicted ATP-grasp superfamily ATP-dependent carboligase